MLSPLRPQETNTAPPLPSPCKSPTPIDRSDVLTTPVARHSNADISSVRPSYGGGGGAYGRGNANGNTSSYIASSPFINGSSSNNDNNTSALVSQDHRYNVSVRVESPFVLRGRAAGDNGSGSAHATTSSMTVRPNNKTVSPQQQQQQQRRRSTPQENIPGRSRRPSAPRRSLTAYEEALASYQGQILSEARRNSLSPRQQQRQQQKRERAQQQQQQQDPAAAAASHSRPAHRLSSLPRRQSTPPVRGISPLQMYGADRRLYRQLLQHQCAQLEQQRRPSTTGSRSGGGQRSPSLPGRAVGAAVAGAAEVGHDGGGGIAECAADCQATFLEDRTPTSQPPVQRLSKGATRAAASAGMSQSGETATAAAADTHGRHLRHTVYAGVARSSRTGRTYRIELAASPLSEELFQNAVRTSVGEEEEEEGEGATGALPPRRGPSMARQRSPLVQPQDKRTYSASPPPPPQPRERTVPRPASPVLSNAPGLPPAHADCVALLKDIEQSNPLCRRLLSQPRRLLRRGWEREAERRTRREQSSERKGQEAAGEEAPQHAEEEVEERDKATPITTTTTVDCDVDRSSSDVSTLAPHRCRQPRRLYDFSASEAYAAAPAAVGPFTQRDDVFALQASLYQCKQYYGLQHRSNVSEGHDKDAKASQCRHHEEQQQQSSENEVTSEEDEGVGSFEQRSLQQLLRKISGAKAQAPRPIVARSQYAVPPALVSLEGLAF